MLQFNLLTIHPLLVLTTQHHSLQLIPILPWNNPADDLQTKLKVCIKPSSLIKKLAGSKVYTTMLKKYPKRYFIPSPQHRLHASPELSAANSVKLQRYTLGQLKAGTSDFSLRNLVGEGASSTVYKGVLHNRTVAIKKLKSHLRFGFRELQAEMNAISQLHHRNILYLIGFCFSEEQRFLIYEFAANNSLAYHLQPGRKQYLDWKTRKKISLGIARGLAYMHHDCIPGMVHLNLTADCVLLDSEFEAKITGFRNAESYIDPNATLQGTNMVKATYGSDSYRYLDNGYLVFGDFNFKTDVYAFGILLLELITGLRVAPSSRGTLVLKEFAELTNKLEKAIKTERFDDLVDRSLPSNYDHDAMARMVLCAAVSICQPEHLRPTMKQIVHVLNGEGIPRMYTKEESAPRPSTYNYYEGGLSFLPSPSSVILSTFSTSSTRKLFGRSSSISLSERISIGPVRYTLQQLEAATNSFSAQRIIGEGGYAIVYKGILGSRTVAIKKLLDIGRRGDQVFETEISAISRLSHANLILLVGYCIDGEVRAMVYEYAVNGSLADHLKPRRRRHLDWETRKKIMLGTARGLAYLHHNCRPATIHRDIKPGNILLDSEFEAKISDFGIAKLRSDSSASHISTRIEGTPGYIDPDYVNSGRLTSKSDVFSYGMLLFGLIIGHEPFSELKQWKKKLITALQKKKFDGLADEELQNAYDHNSMICMTACAAVSILPSVDDRPTMEEIVDVLRGVKSPNDFIKTAIEKRKSLCNF